MNMCAKSFNAVKLHGLVGIQAQKSFLVLATPDNGVIKSHYIVWMQPPLRCCIKTTQDGKS